MSVVPCSWSEVTDLTYGYEYKDCSETKWLWSAPVPPIAGGGGSWSRRDTAMNSRRLLPKVYSSAGALVSQNVSLPDRRLAFCGPTNRSG